MFTIRFYRTLKWVAWHLMRPLKLKDRWGFNLGEDLHDWASMRTFIYLRKMEDLAGFQPTEIAVNPPGLITAGTTSAATTHSITWHHGWQTF